MKQPKSRDDIRTNHADMCLRPPTPLTDEKPGTPWISGATAVGSPKTETVVEGKGSVVVLCTRVKDWPPVPQWGGCPTSGTDSGEILGGSYEYEEGRGQDTVRVA
ncbi:unnamed protein product, partial [Ectocarpus sp. 8 AP-2014]